MQLGRGYTQYFCVLDFDSIDYVQLHSALCVARHFDLLLYIFDLRHCKFCDLSLYV